MPNSSWAIWLPKASPLSAAGGPPSALAAKKAADGRVPVVFTSVADPVLLGLVESIGRPGRNMTGVAGLTSELDVARLQILSEMLGGGSAESACSTTRGVLISRSNTGRSMPRRRA